jgi:hypothetical protein
MKKPIKLGFIFILAAMLLLTSTLTALAAPLSDSAKVTPLSGIENFTSVSISPENLPGTLLNEGGAILPAGFAAGEKEFSGDGIQVSNLTGSANLCFPLANYQFGWSGSVYLWWNGKWTALPTITTPSVESSGASACTTIYENGTYALLVEYHTPVKNEVSRIKACNFIQMTKLISESPVDGQISLEAYIFAGVFDLAKFPLGMEVKYKILNVSPAGSLTGDLAGTTQVAFTEMDGATSIAALQFEDGTVLNFSGDVTPEFTIRFYLPGCYQDYSEDLFDK